VQAVSDRYSISCDISETQFRAIQKFHISILAFILSWLPFLVGTIGMICCSLLRDAGYQILPWPMLAVAVVAVIAASVSHRLRMGLIRRLLSSRTNEASNIPNPA
jgi:hypothetical protein